MRNEPSLQENRCFEKMRFKQSVEVSRQVYEMMDGGKKVFPNEGVNELQAYEIDKNVEKGNGLVVVKLNRSYYAPDEVYGRGAEWVDSFNLNDIKYALDRLANTRYAYN